MAQAASCFVQFRLPLARIIPRPLPARPNRRVTSLEGLILSYVPKTRHSNPKGKNLSGIHRKSVEFDTILEWAEFHLVPP